MAYEARHLRRQKVRYNNANDDELLTYQLVVGGAKVTPTSATIEVFKPGSTTAVLDATAMTKSGTLLTYALDTTTVADFPLDEGFRADIVVTYDSKTYEDAIVFDVVNFVLNLGISRDQLVAMDDRIKAMNWSGDEDFSEVIEASRDDVQLMIESKVHEDGQLLENMILDHSRVAIPARHYILARIFRAKGSEEEAERYMVDFDKLFRAMLSGIKYDTAQDGQEAETQGGLIPIQADHLMANIFQQAIGDILDNYADVIEGGNTWRGSGSSYRGIPGTQPNDADIRSGADDTLTVTVDNVLSTTTFDVASTNSWEESRWVKTDTPSFWALCTTSGAATAPNLDQHRKITGYNDTTKVFTVDPAFSAAPIANDVMTILQGFKRIPNQNDIEDEDEEITTGFDRFFHLRAENGEQIEFFGSGVATYQTELQLRLRLLKHGRAHDVEASAFENMMILRNALTKGANPDHRDSSYTRALLSTGSAPEIINEDQQKVVILDRYILIYRINTSFK